MSQGAKSERNWQVLLLTRSSAVKLNKSSMKKTIQKILSGLECDELPAAVSELSILLTDDEEIRGLNAQYRAKDAPTDVLSFSQLEGDEEFAPPHVLGDIVISLETAKRQAEEANVALAYELLRLVIHGVLHLFGYDHEGVSEDEAEVMRTKEDPLPVLHEGERELAGVARIP